MRHEGAAGRHGAAGRDGAARDGEGRGKEARTSVSASHVVERRGVPSARKEEASLPMRSRCGPQPTCRLPVESALALPRILVVLLRPARFAYLLAAS